VTGGITWSPELVLIVSASRRTDIPAFYGDWFLHRLDAGYCLVPNPFNHKQVSRIGMRRSDVDVFVFWTRNPRPFSAALDELGRRSYPYVVLFTLTGYGPPVEPHAPDAEEAVSAFRALARRVGPERVVWRYDPVVLGAGLGPSAHLERFGTLARELEGSTVRVVTSMVDLYRKTVRRLSAVHGGSGYLIDPVTEPEIDTLVATMATVAADRGMELVTCAEEHDFTAAGARPGACIDGDWLNRLFGLGVTGKDRGQRQHCRCAPSRDIGMHDTCLHGCEYCYATRSHELALKRHALHDPEGEALVPL
jgi:hypothetical protein